MQRKFFPEEHYFRARFNLVGEMGSWILIFPSMFGGSSYKSDYNVGRWLEKSEQGASMSVYTEKWRDGYSYNILTYPKSYHPGPGKRRDWIKRIRIPISKKQFSGFVKLKILIRQKRIFPLDLSQFLIRDLENLATL